MTVNVQRAADRLMELGYESGRPLTPIEVQKLLYFLEGWHLALVDEPLFDEDFIVWKHGPVIESVYNRLKRFGAAPAPRAEIAAPYGAELGERTLDLAQRVFETYREHDPGALVGLTHLPGTPWDEARRSNGVPKKTNSSVVIPKTKIKEWFIGVWSAALEPAVEELIDAEPEEYAEWTISAA